jgi:hypothetical protein
MVGRGVIQDAKTALALLYTVQYVLPAGLAGGGGVSPK